MQVKQIIFSQKAFLLQLPNCLSSNPSISRSEIIRAVPQEGETFVVYLEVVVKNFHSYLK